MVYDKSVDDKGKYGKDNPAFDPEEDLRRGSLSTGVATPSIQYKANENRRMLKNVIVISVAFMFLFTAFQSIAALQSSLNAEVGPYSLSTIYGCLIISSFFLPTFLISRLTVKYTLLFAMLGYIMYIFAQLLPEFYTMIPAAVLTGLCAAPLWSAKCTYLTHLGHQYAALVKEDAEVVIVRFFGIFFFFFQSASVLGNLISSLILNSGSSKNGNDPYICGLNFCPSTDLGNATLQSGGEDNTKRYTLAGVFLVCAFLAAMIIFFLVDPLKRYGEQRKEGNARQLIFATFNQMKNPTQILLIPLTVWSGMEQGFFSSDFTAGFITCVWGVGNVGYVLICYGICDAISSISFGPVIKNFGRLPVFIVGALINSGVIVTLFLWTPNAAESWMFFVLAGLWGVADGIWQCEINAFYGILFPHNEEAAFSNYRLWESLGFIIAYINTNLICMDAKIYTLIGILILGMTGYLTIELKERKTLAEREQRK